MRWLAEQMPAGYCFRATSNVFLVQKGRGPGTARHASVGKPRENARPSPREVRFRRYVAVREKIDKGRRLPRRERQRPPRHKCPRPADRGLCAVERRPPGDVEADLPAG